MANKKTIVMIPTYNESKNIEKLVRKILKLNIKNLGLLIVDDNSPDGTAEIVRSINDSRVHLLLRKGKRGRGLAGKAGFEKALEIGADYIVEMDGDFSHNPIYIPSMLNEIKNYDLILGSRFVKGSEDIGRNILRRLLTNSANRYIRGMLGIPVNDCNSGYRCFRKEVIKSIVNGLNADGPDIVQEVLYKSYLKKYKIKEIPIKFEERREGESKLGIKHFFKGLGIVIKLKFLHIIGKI